MKRKSSKCLIYMQNKHFLFQSFYIFVDDIHILYNDCNMEYQCSAVLQTHKKRGSFERGACVKRDRDTVERWRRRPGRDGAVRRCHICLHTASVKSLCPSRHIQSKTPSHEKLPWRPTSTSPSSLLHFTSRSLALSALLSGTITWKFIWLLYCNTQCCLFEK